MSEMPPGLAAELETLQRKHAQYPEGRYFVPLANARRKAGDLDKAETLLREGMEIHPEYLSAYIVLGRCLEDRGDAAEAEEQFRRVLSRDPQNLVALQHLGEIAARDGRRDDAAHWYQELIGADPMNEGARARLAELEAEEPEAVASETPEEDQRWEGEGGLAREARDPEELGAGEDAEELSDRLPAGLDTEEPWIGTADQDESRIDEEDARVPPVAEAAGEDEDEVPTGGEGPEERGPEAQLGTGGPSEEDRRGDAPFEPVGREEKPGPAEADREASWAAPLEVEDDAVGMGPADSDPTPNDDEVEVGVVTETIASIYARQGLYDRAAAVYRKLLEERGDEPHLRERLAEVERAMADQDRPESEAPSAEAEESDASYAPAEEFSGDEGGAGRDEGRYAFADYSPAAPTPEEEPGVTPTDESDADLWASEEQGSELAEEAGYVGAEDIAPAVVGGGDRDAEREPAGEEESAESLPIGSYLRGLLAWAPPPHPEEDRGEEPAAGGGQDPAGPAGDEFEHAEADLEGEEVATGEATAAEGAPDSFTTEDLVEGLPDPEPDTGSAQESADREGGAPSDEEELWLAPPPEEETEPERSGSPAAEGGHSVETFAEQGDTELEEVASSPEEEAVPENAEDAASGVDEKAKEEGEERTDDDLQSFQAWLKSLKR